MAKTMQDMILQNRLNVLAECDTFQHCFKIRINQFWQGNVLGFDVVKFDGWVGNKNPKMSLQDAVLEKYGDEGVRIIKKLLFIE
jgi:hypothetical protein